MSLTIKIKNQRKYDWVSLGKIMFDHNFGEGGICTARRFSVWEGDGESNASRGLRRYFGYKTVVCTASADNEASHLVKGYIMRDGVDTDFIQRRSNDGIGRSVRNDLNFTEWGFGIRGADGAPDYGNIAASQLKSGDFDEDHIFCKIGTCWLYASEFLVVLSETTAAIVALTWSNSAVLLQSASAINGAGPI